MTRPVSVTAVGNAQIDTAQSKFGGASALFDGDTNTYLLVDHTAQDIAYSDDFTFECWVRWASLPTAYSMLAQHSSRGDYFSLYNKGGTYTMHAAVSNGSSVFYPIFNTPVTPTTNTWYHLAYVKSGSTFKMFWNGTECTTNNGSVGSMSADKGSNGIRRIGDYGGGSSYAMNGHMDEVRYSNTARYTSNFTPPTAPHVNDANTLLLVHMDGTDASTVFLDDNGNGRSAVGVSAAGNAQVDTAQSKFSGASLLLDGYADYIYIAGGNNWDLSGDFTLETWVYQTSNSKNEKIFDLRGITGSNPGADTGVALGSTLLIDSNTGGDFRCFIDGADRSTAGSGSIPLNTWTHIAVQRQSGTINAWVNGTRYVNYVGSDDYSSVFNVNQPIGAGGAQTGNLSGWSGNIDEVRISDTARYTNGTSITVPSIAFTNDDDTLLLLHMDGTDGSTTFIDDNGSGRSAVGISAIGNAQIDTAQSKFGGASAYFDGTGDYLQFVETVPNTGDFTIEMWFRPANTGERFDLFSVTGSGEGRCFLNTTTGNKLQFFIGSTAGNILITGTTSYSANTWYHAAISRSGDNWKVFLNGNLEGSTTASRTIASDDNYFGFRVGAPGDVMRGHIDEVRISSTARYTTGFTPPTAPHVNDADTLLLLHMDGTDASTVFLDDNGYFETAPAGVTHEGAATLSATATFSATAAKIRTAVANLNVSATQSTTAGKIIQGNVDINAAWTASILAVASKNGSIDAAAVITMSTDVERTRSSEVTLSNIVNLSLQAAKILSTDSTLSSAVTLSTAAARTRSTESLQAVSASLSTTATRIKQFGATLTGAFTPTITAVASLNGEIDILATASINADVSKIHPGSANLTGQFGITANGGYLFEDIASLATSTSATATAIEYIRKTSYPNDRPATFSIVNGTWTIDTSRKKHGSGSLKNINDSLGGLDRFDIQSVDYYNSGSTTESFTFEFWYNTQQLNVSTTDKLIAFPGGSGNGSIYFDRVYQTNGNYFADITFSSINTPVPSFISHTFTDIPFEPDSWHHFAIQFKPPATGIPNLKFSIDNTYTYESFTSTSDNPKPDQNYLFYTYNDSENLLEETNFDSISIRKGNNSGNYIPLQGYTSEPTNDETETLALFLFNGDTNDGPLFMTLDGAADLNATATVTANLGGTFGADADLTATASISADVEKIKGANAEISSALTLSADVGVIEQFNSALNSAFSLNSTAQIIKGTQCSLQAEVTQTTSATRIAGLDSSISVATQLSTTGTRIKQLDAALSAFVVTLTAAGRVSDFFIDCENYAALSALAVKTVSGEIDLAANANLAATSTRIKPLQADLAVSTNLATDAFVGKVGSADLSTSATLSADVDKIIGLNASLSTTSNLTASANVSSGNEMIADAVIQLSVDGNRIRFADSSLETPANIAATAVKTVDASATLSTEGGFVIDAQVNIQGDIDLVVAARLDSTANKRVDVGSELSAQANTATTAAKTATGTIVLNTSTALAAQGGGISNGALDVAVQCSLVAQGGIIQTDRYIYVIPSESRSFTIASETRAYTINQETRSYTLGEQ